MPEEKTEATQPLPSCARSVIIGSNSEGTRVKMVPIFCHKWSCPRCGKAKSALWRSYALAGEPQRLITLTAKPLELFNKRDQMKRLKKAFAKLVQKYRRKYGVFEYLAVWELTKQGTPHIHVLQRGGFIPQTKLSEDWRTLTGNYIVDVRAVKSQEQIARYVVKYLTKSLGSLSEVMTGLRVVQKSKNWILPKHKELFDKASAKSSSITGWYFAFARPAEVSAYIESVMGFKQAEESTEEAISFHGPPKLDLALTIAFAFDRST